MFSKKNRQNQMIYPQPYFNPYMNNQYQEGFNPGNMPNYDVNFLETEINELKRQTLEISRRLSKIENYLGIRNEEEKSSPLF